MSSREALRLAEEQDLDLVKIAAGNKVKVSIRMRGRQNAHSALGVDVMNRFFELVKDVAVMEKKPLLEGRNILMILAPSKSN